MKKRHLSDSACVFTATSKRQSGARRAKSNKERDDVDLATVPCSPVGSKFKVVAVSSFNQNTKHFH